MGICYFFLCVNTRKRFSLFSEREYSPLELFQLQKKKKQQHLSELESNDEV